MMQKPNTVFVGKKINTAGSTLAVGDIVLVNGDTGAVVATSGLSSLKNIQLGFVKAIGATDAAATVVKTQVIGKDKITSITPNNTCAYSAPVEAQAVVDFSGVTIVAGYRYVIRVIYKDLYEHPGQFTHSYEVVASGSDTIDTVGAKFAAAITKHAGARVTAGYVDATNLLTLDAKSVVLNGFGTQGKEAITPYSQVKMHVVAYYSNPTAFFSNRYNQIPGLVITETASMPGKGNPYIVRDREQAALAYKGITYRIQWPVIKPDLNVDLTKTYDTLTFEFKKNYQSPDNQYVKATDIATEIYVEVGGGATETLRDALASWAGLA